MSLEEIKISCFPDPICVGDIIYLGRGSWTVTYLILKIALGVPNKVTFVCLLFESHGGNKTTLTFDVEDDMTHFEHIRGA